MMDKAELLAKWQSFYEMTAKSNRTTAGQKVRKWLTMFT